MAIAMRITNPPAPHFDAMQSKLAELINPDVFKAATLAGGMIARVLTTQHGGSGQLARSFLPATYIKQEGDRVSAGALSDLPYAAIQNRGGVITPKTAKALAVPISAKAKTMWPRDWPRDALAFVKSKKTGVPLLIDAKAETKRPIVHYVLKRSQEIEPKRYLERSAKEITPKLRELFRDTLGELA